MTFVDISAMRANFRMKFYTLLNYKIYTLKFATALLMYSCGSTSQMVCRATFSSSVALGSAGVYGNFSDMVVGSPDVIVQWVQNWRVSMNPKQFACSQFCMKLER